MTKDEAFNTILTIFEAQPRVAFCENHYGLDDANKFTHAMLNAPRPSSVLMYAFSWAVTNEGGPYWSEVHSALLRMPKFLKEGDL